SSKASTPPPPKAAWSTECWPPSPNSSATSSWPTPTKASPPREPAAGRAASDPSFTAHQAELAQQLYDAREKTVQQIADLFTVPRTTVYGYLNRNDQTDHA